MNKQKQINKRNKKKDSIEKTEQDILSNRLKTLKKLHEKYCGNSG